MNSRTPRSPSSTVGKEVADLDAQDVTVATPGGQPSDSAVARTGEKADPGMGDSGRDPELASTHSGSAPPAGGPAGPSDQAVADDGIEGAKTVITGPNRPGIPLHPSGGGTPAEIARVLLGHQLDHFELETLIGGGGMGAVFRARDTRLDRTVAIKVIPRVGDDPELLRRFRNEAQSAARLDHPNIARVYDVGRHEGWHYIVFEYIEGTNLRDLIERDGLLSVDDAVYFTRQVAEALDHAHRRGVTHRDIKPSNVLVTPNGQVKLVDMGLARAQQLEMSEDMTASGVTLGTFDYISPEQARDPRDADVRSDIYSLGCTLYFALTGRPPYPSGTVLQKLLSHGSSPLPDPRLVRGDLSENLVAVLHKMLAKQPSDRYRRPLDLISDLYLLAEREHLPRALSAGSIAVVQSSRFSQLVEQHLPWLVAVALLLVTTAWLQLLSSAGGDLLMTQPVPTSHVSAAGADRSGEAPDADSILPPAGGQSGQGAAVSSASVEAATGDAETGSANNPQDPPEYADVAPPVAVSEIAANGAPEPVVAAAEIPGPRPSVIRVIGAQADGAGDIDSENRQLVTSLEEAFEAVRSDPGISTIEIGPTVIRSGPVTLPRGELTIRGVSEASVLEFASSEPASMERPVLFDLDSHSVDFQGLHIVWQCPTMAIDGGTLFEMSGGNTLAFSDCSITVANAMDRPSVYVFETSFDAAAPAAVPPLAAIQMSDTIVRGGATMWRLDRTAPQVEVRWDNGLLAITGSMIETGGAVTSIAAGAVRMRLIMNDVTAVPGGGLVRVALDSGADQPIVVDREANRCVFSLDPEVPLVKMVGLEDASVVDRFVVLRGHDNWYDSAGGRTQQILTAVSTDGNVVQYGISDLLAPDKPKWIPEILPQGIVVWTHSVPLDTPPHVHRPEDYLLESLDPAGFRIDELPELPSSRGDSAAGGI